jgi:hypothetical protein
VNGFDAGDFHVVSIPLAASRSQKQWGRWPPVANARKKSNG